MFKIIEKKTFTPFLLLVTYIIYDIIRFPTRIIEMMQNIIVL